MTSYKLQANEATESTVDADSQTEDNRKWRRMQLESAAYHEAGHVAVDLAFDFIVWEVWLADEDPEKRHPYLRDVGGSVDRDQKQPPHTLARLGPWIAGSFGGFVAERRFWRKKYPEFNFLNPGYHGAQHDFAGIEMANPLSRSPSDLTTWRMFARHWEQISRAVVTRSWSWIETMAAELLQKRELDSDELDELNADGNLQRIARAVVRERNQGWTPPEEIARVMQARSRKEWRRRAALRAFSAKLDAQESARE